MPIKTFRSADDGDAVDVSALIMSTFGPTATPGWTESARIKFRSQQGPDRLDVLFATAAYQQVCEHDGMLVGCVYFSKPHQLSLLAEHPDYQRQAIGKQLLQNTLGFISTAHHKISIVEVNATDHSLPFNSKNGFHPLSSSIEFNGTRFTHMGYWRGLSISSSSGWSG